MGIECLTGSRYGGLCPFMRHLFYFLLLGVDKERRRKPTFLSKPTETGFPILPMVALMLQPKT